MRVYELEALVAANAHNHAQLLEIREELSYRRSPRAKRLSNKIDENVSVAVGPVSPVAVPTWRAPPSQQSGLPPRSIGRGLRSPSIGRDSRSPRATYRGGSPTRPLPAQRQSTGQSAPHAQLRRQKTPKPLLNRPRDILDSWVAQEVLSPTTYKRPEDLGGGDRRLIFDFSNKPLPWEAGGERARPRTRLYYHVLVGGIRMDRATQALLAAYGAKNPEFFPNRDRAALAFLTVNSRGVPSTDKPPVVSSFAWGLAYARRGDLESLARWNAVEQELQRELADLIVRRNADGEVLPLTSDLLNDAFTWLRSKLRLVDGEVERPRYLVRSYRWNALRDSPDPLLLNSFFLRDIGRARALVERGRAGSNVDRYLGALPVDDRIDMHTDADALEAAVSPGRTFRGKWPSKGQHSLVLLQQAAVNTAFADLKHSGLAGINGPPGTGKTTLLRDVVAGVVVARAERLAAFASPEDSFQHLGQMKVGSGFVHLYGLPKSISGFELLVASSNNKAVENVSKELPGIEAVDDSAVGGGYYRSVSDALAGQEGSTWGLMAATLGNSKNRSVFRKAFWQDPDHGLSAYLKTAAGQNVLIPDPDQPGHQGREPAVVVAEDAPRTPQQAKTRWHSARRKFASLLNEVNQDISELDRIHDATLQLETLQDDLKAAELQLEVSDREDRRAVSSASITAERHRSAEAAMTTAVAQQEQHAQQKPGFWCRLFQTRAWREWLAAGVGIANGVEHAQYAAAEAERQAARAEQLRIASRHAMQDADRCLLTVRKQVQSVHLVLDQARRRLGPHYAGIAFWSQSRAVLHQSTPWLYPELQRKREGLFVAALGVHRAFHGVAAKPLRHNLSALMQVFIGKGLPERLSAALPELWKTLFLFTPVVSTTFASVDRMFGDLPVGTFGWALLDEAGQALPQAAVGVLLRARRALVVGDPLQIEPVVALQDELISAVCEDFGVDAEVWAAPKASVQTLVDCASRHGADLVVGEGSIWVGMPLLVHRRCVDPMFAISNIIAYSNQMISAAPKSESAIRRALGVSHWRDVHSSSADKWSCEEGEVVIDLLRRIVGSVANPDIFVISPFRIVAQRMRERIHQEAQLLSVLSDNPRDWVRGRVGTVHTFQGKEAEAVILLLGAPSMNQRGARAWAGGRPNLLNVAVTRAKSAIYVVGNRELWKQHGVFGVLDRHLPVRHP